MTALRHRLAALLSWFDFCGPALAQQECVTAILARSDRDAIAHDWQAVRDDLRQVMSDMSRVSPVLMSNDPIDCDQWQRDIDAKIDEIRRSVHEQIDRALSVKRGG